MRIGLQKVAQHLFRLKIYILAKPAQRVGISQHVVKQVTGLPLFFITKRARMGQNIQMVNAALGSVSYTHLTLPTTF